MTAQREFLFIHPMHPENTTGSKEHLIVIKFGKVYSLNMVEIPMS